MFLTDVQCFQYFTSLQAHTAEGVHHSMCGASGSEMRRGSGLYEGAHDEMSLDWVSNKRTSMFLLEKRC